MNSSETLDFIVLLEKIKFRIKTKKNSTNYVNRNNRKGIPIEITFEEIKNITNVANRLLRIWDFEDLYLNIPTQRNPISTITVLL